MVYNNSITSRSSWEENNVNVNDAIFMLKYSPPQMHSHVSCTYFLSTILWASSQFFQLQRTVSPLYNFTMATLNPLSVTCAKRKGYVSGNKQ